MIKFKQKMMVLLSSIFCLCFFNFAKAQDPAQLSSMQTTLQTYTASLEQIDNYLEKGNISQERVNLFEKQLKQLQSEVTEIKKYATQNLNQQEALMEVLGPAPTKDEAPEDDVTKAKRTAIQDEVTKFQGMVKLTESLLFEIKKHQDDLVALSLTNKAKGLLARQEPLYDSQVLTYAWKDKVLAKQAITQAYAKAGLTLANTNFKINYGLILFYGFLAFYLAIPFAFILYKKYGQRRKDAQPGTFRKIFTGVIQLLCFAVLPIFSIGLLLVLLKISAVVPTAIWSLMLTSFLPISMFVFSCVIAHIIFPLHKPSWLILPLTFANARRVKSIFILFMFLVVVNWYCAKLFGMGLLSVDFYFVIDFVLRLFACLVGLSLINKNNWTIAVDGSQQISRIQQHWLASVVKYLAMMIFISNPILIFFGFLQLANSLFLSFIEIILLVIFLLSAHFILGELLGRFFFGKEEKNNAKKVALHYWTMLLIDIIFFLIGLFFILISVGIDKAIILRYVMPIFSGIKIGHYVFSINILLLSILTLFLLYVLTRLIQRALRNKILPHTSFDAGTRQAIVQGIGYIGIIIAIIAALLSLGVNFTNLAIIAGALSVGIGFGLQNIVSNFISGVIMLIERPIKVGDRIVVGVDEGIVRRISVRATEIETFDHSSVLIPNSELISGRLQNWTFHSPLNRISVSVGVAYGTDVKLVEALLLEVAQESENVVNEPAPRIYFDDFGDSALVFRLLVFIYDINLRNRTPSLLRFAIEEKFRQHKIEIPFPQREISIKK